MVPIWLHLGLKKRMGTGHDLSHTRRVAAEGWELKLGKMLTQD